MKKRTKCFVIAFGLILVNDQCLAELAHIDKSAVSAVAAVNPQIRDGAWLKWACEEHKALLREPGTLWQKTDTNRENLGAGLCVGFVFGVMSTPGIKPCLAKQKVDPEVVLGYLQDHPDSLLKPAEQLVVEALSAKSKCD
jgi:hypothetical protein